MHVNLDPQLVDKIANEVKSQGVFDQFRKDSMADVDTKPAYQNLRQRVENTVNKFLSEQKWTPDLNKNQLREKLRKHITEAGFLDVGVERIVDQVVNPKIATVFQPKIEDIAYKYLGIPKPQVKVNTTEVPTLNGMLTIETDLMPTDLEQVSPDSDKGTHKSDSKDDVELDDKMDDFESPPFEPIEVKPSDQEMETNGCEKKMEIDTDASENPAHESVASEECLNAEKTKVETSTPVKMEVEREIVVSGEASQESQLSQVSSDSRLSIVTNDNTQEDHTVPCKIKEENDVNISEEAQMPKFNENSNSSSEKKSSEPLHFDIKKDEIKFEGTERKVEPHIEESSPNINEENRLDASLENKIIDNSQNSDIPLPSHEFSFERQKEFIFPKVDVNVDLEEVSKTASLDDSADRELQIIEKSEVSQCSVSLQSIKSPTPKQEKMPKPSSATSSPSQHRSTYREKEHSSSSRHKKHSKDRRSEKERHSSSAHRGSSTTSLKSHHSSKTSSSHKDHHHHRGSSSSVHKSRHSSKNGKSARSHHDSKDSHSRDHSKTKTDKSKEKSSKDKSDRSKTSDDHYSSKQKWRKSTDSNDEGDSSRDENRTSVPKDNSSSRDNATNGTLNNSNTSSGNSAANNPSDAGVNTDAPCSNNVISQNVVILDNLLENPETNFIEIGNARFQVNKSNQAPNCFFDGNSLYYFENDSQSKQDFDSRIRMLTHNMEDIRKLLQRNLLFPRKLSTTESEGNTTFDVDKIQTRPHSASPRSFAMKRNFESPNTPPSLTSATLTIDCIQYGTTSSSNCLSKRFKFNGTSVTKVSPTPSELSVNSKENEFVDKNAQSDSESSGYPEGTKLDVSKTALEKRNKFNRNQRYSSEDLYKPRPILSQRSRRRGLDAII